MLPEPSRRRSHFLSRTVVSVLAALLALTAVPARGETQDAADVMERHLHSLLVSSAALVQTRAAAIVDLKGVVHQLMAPQSPFEVSIEGVEPTSGRFVVLNVGDQIRIRVKNVSAQPRRLLLAYVMSDGTLSVLPGDPSPLSPGAERVTRALKVSPPLGLDLVLALDVTEDDASKLRELQDVRGPLPFVRELLEIEQLLAARGATRVLSPAAVPLEIRETGSARTPLSVPAVKSSVVELLTASLAAPEHSRLLLFAQDERLRLHAHILHADGRVESHPLSASLQRLREDAARLREALGVDAAILTRAPRQKSAPPPPNRGVAREEESSVDAAAVEQAIRGLSGALFPGKVAAALAGARHLVIVPTSDLGTMPFAMLQPLRDGKPAVEHFSVTVAPGISALLREVKPWTPRFSAPLIVGNPAPMQAPGWEMPALPGARAEAAAVAKQLQVKALLGPEADRTRVVKQASKADLLYLATHAVADSKDAMNNSFIALGGGNWSAKEIMLTRLGARLAVLSACQTGLGQRHDAGVIGVARAFYLAGVPRTLMSLWSVDDAATAALMTRFMVHAGSVPPAEALRRAMLDLRKEDPNPAHWGSFTLFGTHR